MRRKITVLLMAIIIMFCFSGCSFLMLAAVVDIMDSEEIETVVTQPIETTKESVTEPVTPPETEPVTEPEIDKVTVLIYMNGSDLETDEGQATLDLEEMLRAPYSENVNIVVQTMGTMAWSDKYNISSDESQRFLLQEDDLKLVSNKLGQLDCTSPYTLKNFIKWGVREYPAERYILLFWNHGGGPVYGFGYDEYQGYDERLTLDEIHDALEDCDTDFELIGMDCCIMSSLEVCYALYDYCDYMILSEEFETGIGWSYEGFFTSLVNNPEISIEELAHIIIDDMIEENELDYEDEPSTLALINQSMIKVLYSAWKDFAYMHEEELLRADLKTGITASKRAFSDIFESEETLADYYLTDIMTVARSLDSKEAKVLESVLKDTILYYKGTGDVENLTGLSVTIPYGDVEFYSSLKRIFIDCGMDREYVEWLEKFAYVSNKGFEFVD